MERINDIMDSAMVLIQVDGDWPECQGFHDMLSAIALQTSLCLVIPDKYDTTSPEEFIAYTGNKLLIRGVVDSPTNTERLIQFFAKAGVTQGSTVELLDRPF